MSLIPWNNFDDAFPRLPSNFDDFFTTSLARGTRLPAVNIKEEDDKFLISLAVPGLKKEDCKVKVENGMLTVSAEQREEKKDEKEGKYSRYEYNFSSFSRSFSLPENADADNITAKQEDGELKITLPKKEPTEPSKKEITVE